MSQKHNPKARFQHQDSELTLAQGLEEFYAINAHKFSKPEPVSEWSKLMVAHDACHVLFGVNTDLVEESLGDMWTLCGTTMTFKEYLRYAKNEEARELMNQLGLKAMILGGLKSVPGAVKVFLRSRQMTKKWDLWHFTDHLDEKLVDLRKEYNLKILNA